MSTAFVTLANPPYFIRAKQTIKDLRTRGKWLGPVVLISVECDVPEDFVAEYNVTVVSFPRFDVTEYVAKMREKPLTVPTHDRRETEKTVQWEKLHVFEPYFKKWERIVWLDAGLRVLDSVAPLLSLDWRGRFLAPDDTVGKTDRFSVAVELVNWPEALTAVQTKYGVRLDDRYFLNCIWVHDTSLPVTMGDFLECLAYPIWRHNEMGVMNAVLHFKHGCWVPFPATAPVGGVEAGGKFLFDWCELNRGPHAKWDEYIFLKYPVTIKFDV
jgi:hypothetical protein